MGWSEFLMFLMAYGAGAFSVLLGMVVGRWSR